MSKKQWSSFNFIVSVIGVVAAFLIFTSRHRSTEDRGTARQAPAASAPVISNESEARSAPIPADSAGSKTAENTGGSSASPGQPLGSLPVEVLNSTGPESASALPPEMAAQLKAAPPQLPDDLKHQLEGPPPELPDDLKAQLNAPPPPIPDDIKRALETPPRTVSIDEVNGTAQPQ